MRTVPALGRTLALTAAALLIAGSLGACSGAAASPSSGGITVTGAWIRDSPAVAGAVAGYFVVTNGGTTADALLSASTPIAKTVELHQTMVMDSAAPAASAGMAGTGSAMPSASSDGSAMMGMVPVARVNVPPGGSVQFAPGGFHLMIMDLTGTLTVGQTVDLTLVFEKAGSITVKAEVRTQ
jgi:copper(I)-binding protein